MRSIIAALRTLVLPWGAGPGTPRTVIGPDIPADIVAYYAAAPYAHDVVSVFLSYDAWGRVWYEAALTFPGLSTVFGHGRGIWDEAQGSVSEAEFVTYDAGPQDAAVWLGGRASPVGTKQLQIAATTDVLYAGESIVDATSWTPTWDSSGGGFAMGASVSEGRYRKQGDLMWAMARLTLGVGFNLGAGDLQVTDVPPGGDPNFSYQSLVGIARDDSAPVHFPIATRTMSTGGGALAERLFILATGANVTAVAPIAAPAAGDIFQVAGFYSTT